MGRRRGKGKQQQQQPQLTPEQQEERRRRQERDELRRQKTLAKRLHKQQQAQREREQALRLPPAFLAVQQRDAAAPLAALQQRPAQLNYHGLSALHLAALLDWPQAVPLLVGAGKAVLSGSQPSNREGAGTDLVFGRRRREGA